MRVVELKLNNRVVIPQCRIATSFFSRFMGLMGKRELSPKEAIVFPHCNSVHTFFMRIPIDVVLVSGDGAVIETIAPMHPWRMMVPRKGVKHIVEMAPELSKKLGIEPGVRLDCEGVWS